MAEWMAADEYHQPYSPNLFYAEGTETLVFEDEHGPILFVNLSRALRAFVQFAPSEAKRTRAALPEAFGFVQERGRAAGFRELLFESVAQRVINFCVRRLRFQKSPNEFKAYL